MTVSIQSGGKALEEYRHIEYEEGALLKVKTVACCIKGTPGAVFSIKWQMDKAFKPGFNHLGMNIYIDGELHTFKAWYRPNLKTRDVTFETTEKIDFDATTGRTTTMNPCFAELQTSKWGFA